MPTPADRLSARRAQRPVRYALALLILVIGALVAAGVFASYRIYDLGNHRFIDQAAPFFAVTEDLAVEVLNEETAVRGYVITGNPKTLQPYNQGKKYVNLEVGIIAKDQSFDPRIPADLKSMQGELATLQRYFAQEIALVKSGPAGKRQAASQILTGKAHFDHLRASSARLIADAASVVNRSHKEQHRTLVDSFAFLGVVGLLALAITVGLLLIVPRRLYSLFREERRARRDAEQGADASRALAHVRDAVLLLDGDAVAGKVRYWNPAAHELFGVASENEASPEVEGVL
ncbi:MAG TPA: CHASE3 domain-containing protein, partial [Gaiellaceae bacterium]